MTGKQKHLSSTPTDAGDVEEDDGILPRPPHPRPPHPTPPPPPHPNPVPNPVPNPDDIDKKTGNIPKIKIPVRGFVIKDEYVLILKPKKAFNGDIQLLASGEENAEKLEIIEARTEEKNLSIRNGKISGFSMTPDNSCKILVLRRFVKNRGIAGTPVPSSQNPA